MCWSAGDVWSVLSQLLHTSGKWRGGCWPRDQWIQSSYHRYGLCFPLSAQVPS